MSPAALESTDRTPAWSERTLKPTATRRHDEDDGSDRGEGVDDPEVSAGNQDEEVQPMEFRQFGTTGIEVSEVGFGAWAWR